MHLNPRDATGAADALLARHTATGTSLALIPLPEVPALHPAHTRKSHDVIGDAPSTIKKLALGINVRRISPREVSEFALDLYAAGVISFEDYSTLSQHPELNPHYNKTIGALTNEPAHPDRKRDFVRYWESKLDFYKRYQSLHGEPYEQAKRIVGLLRYLSRRVINPIV